MRYHMFFTLLLLTCSWNPCLLLTSLTEKSLAKPQVTLISSASWLCFLSWAGDWFSLWSINRHTWAETVTRNLFLVPPVCRLFCPRTFGRGVEGARRRRRFCLVSQNQRFGPLCLSPVWESVKVFIGIIQNNVWENVSKIRACELPNLPGKEHIPVDEFLSCDNDRHRGASHIWDSGSVHSIS